MQLFGSDCLIHVPATWKQKAVFLEMTKMDVQGEREVDSKCK